VAIVLFRVGCKQLDMIKGIFVEFFRNGLNTSIGAFFQLCIA